MRRGCFISKPKSDLTIELNGKHLGVFPPERILYVELDNTIEPGDKLSVKVSCEKDAGPRYLVDMAVYGASEGNTDGKRGR